jgi:hypothetical protein
LQRLLTLAWVARQHHEAKLQQPSVLLAVDEVLGRLADENTLATQDDKDEAAKKLWQHCRVLALNAPLLQAAKGRHDDYGPNSVDLTAWLTPGRRRLYQRTYLAQELCHVDVPSFLSTNVHLQAGQSITVDPNSHGIFLGSFQARPFHDWYQNVLYMVLSMDHPGAWRESRVCAVSCFPLLRIMEVCKAVAGAA